jgi:hypothetical protein
VKHDEKHAVGMWIVAAVLGGFAVLYWGADLLERGGEADGPRPGIEAPDSSA